MTGRPMGRLVYGMPSEEYHAGPEVSAGVLHSMAKSAAHCYALHLAEGRPPRKPTPRMLSGTLAHCAVLEPDVMASRYVTVPEDAPRRPTSAQWKAKKPSSESLAAMEWWTEFNARAAGRQIITAEEFATTRHQLSAVLAVPELAQLLSAGDGEVSAFWTDEATGLRCRCRPDWVHPLADGRVILLDLKTTSDVSPSGFARTVWNFGYYRAAAHYSRGYAAASGQEVAAFVFGAVTSEYPFIAMPYMLDDAAIERGYSECAELLQAYATCMASGRWPAYGEGVQTVSLPAWAT